MDRHFEPATSTDRVDWRIRNGVDAVLAQITFIQASKPLGKDARPARPVIELVSLGLAQDPIVGTFVDFESIRGYKTWQNDHWLGNLGTFALPSLF